jgi:methylthioribose-1-phosphate isomerase
MTESLKYSRGSLEVLDQLLLPHETKYVPVNGVNDAWSVIRTMQVRGAPLIAITAVLGLAVELANRKSEFITNQENLLNFLSTSIAYLRTSRPTAVNLFIALDEVSSRISSRVVESSPESLLEEVVKMAEDLFAADVTMNKEIGRYGADKILSLVQRDRVRVLTICNTGSLATAGYGTALGVVRALHERGALEHVYACETRPYNQGARLTAYEIVQDGLPGTLICDNMASALMAVKGVDVVITGADRVVANGDTANKIGTYQLAIAAKYHGIPFFTALPTSTIDLTKSSGIEIHVEERPAHELTR